jgi:hypothetical protein
VSFERQVLAAIKFSCERIVAAMAVPFAVKTFSIPVRRLLSTARFVHRLHSISIIVSESNECLCELHFKYCVAFLDFSEMMSVKLLLVDYREPM